MAKHGKRDRVPERGTPERKGAGEAPTAGSGVGLTSGAAQPTPRRKREKRFGHN